jgi:hemolysin activation/secretion protein
LPGLKRLGAAALAQGGLVSNLRLVAAATVLLAAAASGPLHAQISVPVDQLPRPSDQPLPVPPPIAPKPQITLPPLPAPEGPALSRGVTVVVKAFRFVGNTAVPSADLEAIAKPFLGRPIGNAQLEELRLLLTRRYVEAGYVNSGAVIPDQDVSDGVITFRVVEGRLSEIVIGGQNRFAPDYLRDRIALGAGPPLNVNDLQERMQIMLQDPMIERMSAELAPGVERGDAVLRVDVTEAKRFIGGVTLSNDRSPVVGENQAELFVAARNLLGRGDTFGLRGAFTEGLDDYSAYFGIPVTARGTLFTLRGTRTNSRVVEAPLDQLDISSRGTSVDGILSHPLYETARETVTGSMTLTRRSIRNYFLGEPSPFIPGAPDGKIVISAFRLGVEAVARTEQQVASGRLLYSHGLDAFGSTVSDEPGVPDSRFDVFLAQLQWVRLVAGRDGQIVLRGDAQLTGDALLGPERYSLGGMNSVRGYRTDLLVRDNGWFASLEYRHRIANLPVRPNAGPGEGAVRLVAFFDYGRAWDERNPPNALKSIWSVGPGVRWEPVPGLNFEFYYGVALRDVTTPTNTLSDKGVHLRLAFVQPF